MNRKHTKQTHMWRSLAVSAIVFGSLVLTACNGDDAAGAGEDGPAAENGEAADNGELASEQELTVAAGTFPVTLDPHEYPESAVQAVVQHFMDPLLRLEGEDFEPTLAESWDTPDELTWVFNLRDDVEFHDGSPFTAEDVRASIERLIDAEGTLAPLWDPVDEIEVTDDHTLTIRTEEPMGTMLSTASLLLIGPADQMDEEGYWQEPVGTGPFVVEEFATDERLVMTQNEDYWDGAPDLDRLEYQDIPEDAARITALTTGEVDVLTSVPTDQVSTVDGEPGVVFETGPGLTYYFNWFNASEEPFDDERVRQAMWYAVDTASMVEDLYGDGAELARAPIPQEVFGAPELDPYPYDPERALELLEEAGYPDGFQTSLQWDGGTGETQRAVAQTMISHWAEIGVEVEPLDKERAQWLEDLEGLNFAMNLQRNSVATGDADYTLGRLYTCEADRMGYCNEELDQLLSDARAAVDPDERIDLYHEASEIIWEEAIGIFPIDLAENAAYRERVQGFELQPNGRHRFHEVSVTDE